MNIVTVPQHVSCVQVETSKTTRRDGTTIDDGRRRLPPAPSSFWVSTEFQLHRRNRVPSVTVWGPGLGGEPHRSETLADDLHDDPFGIP